MAATRCGEAYPQRLDGCVCLDVTLKLHRDRNDQFLLKNQWLRGCIPYRDTPPIDFVMCASSAIWLAKGQRGAT